MFHVLGVSGSPKREGNTEILIEAAFRPFIQAGHTVHRFFLSEKKVLPCRACEGCASNGVCVIEDDMKGLLEELKICDAVIIGSPVYMRNISAQLKAVFDRFHCCIFKSPFVGKAGGAIAVGGAANSQGTVLNIIYSFFLSQGIYCVPARLNGVSAVAMKKGEVKDQPESLRDAERLGENILGLLTKLAGR